MVRKQYLKRAEGEEQVKNDGKILSAMERLMPPPGQGKSTTGDFL